MRTDDPRVDEAAWGQARRVAVRQIDDRIDVGGLTFETSLHDELMLGRRPVYQNPDLASDLSLLRLRDDPLLPLHQPLAALPLDGRRDVVGDGERARAFFVRIGEHPEVIEARVLDKRLELGEFLFSFSREPDDECRPENQL